MTQSATRPRILLAEDHLDSREALRDLLEAFGFEVIEAANGLQAVSAATELHPNLILMDINMPELDGMEAIQLLRRSPQTQAIPIIAVTAMDDARELALEAGADDYVAKPVDMVQLIGRVFGWLGDEAD